MEKYYSNCKKNVGAGFSTFISTADGLGQFIFRQNIEKIRALREIMDGKVFNSCQSRRFNL